MNLSATGLKLIQDFESYMIELPDGGCRSYQCRVGTRNGKPVYDGKWTIGFGVTEGVTESTVWTRAQADEAFRRELEKHEAAVNRLVTVELTQPMFDALCSFSYNCGTGALQGSTLLKKLNGGDYEGAAQQFARWNKSQGLVVAGLTRRRAAEAALFSRPVEASPEPAMPQTVDTPPETPEASRINAAAARQQRDQVIGGTAGGSIPVTPPPADTTPIPGPIPPGARQSVDNTLGDLSWVKSTFGTMVDLGTFVGSKWWFIAGGIALYFLARSFWDSQRIKAFRAEDHANGFTVK